MSAQSYYELYRGSSLGLSLTDTLDDLINDGRIEPQLAMKILSNYDRVVTEVLAEKVRARLTFKGHLDTYRFCDEVWTFLIKDVTFKLDTQQTVQADRVKIKPSSMPRSLPWLTNTSTKPEKHSNQDSASPTPRARRASPPRTPRRGNGNNDDQAAAAWETPRHIDVLRSSRSPPTSPIQAIPAEEYIIEGFDNDDMYIMVEDEFYAVAQLFTRHLHQAEYVRRKKEAKKQSALVINNLSRPTDGHTAMRRETLKRKESERLQELQQSALVSPRPRPGTESDPDAEEEDVDDLDEDRRDDPWYGTSLHTLMTSPRKHRSLVGLDAIRSNTRAAAGYRPEVARQQRIQSVVSRDTPAAVSVASVSAATANPVGAASSEDDDDDDDDLEIIESRSSRPVTLPQSSVRTRPPVIKAESPEADIKPSIRQHTTSDGHVSSTHSRQEQSERYQPRQSKQPDRSATSPSRNVLLGSQANSLRARKRALIDDLDDVAVKEEDQEEKVSIVDIIQGQPRKSLSSAAHHQNESTAKKSRLNNVPTFLV
ncbi:uncharacterized protein TRUGW13939_05168 [Talaromyces rugulosus]|uniref:Transcription initiation factor IIA subunit 2 n=1 Tax=Talaromyces rugulosus TaxID=121627 RepID=A0A7H8QWP8_TALRU|nr:uncharacterized protein TRUGW13939_05168 [Talaromyces rugulosus]QKX58048.1 hypothetical protein TRUGW13939_05168 [Talaromyces rugulosus]